MFGHKTPHTGSFFFNVLLQTVFCSSHVCNALMCACSCLIQSMPSTFLYMQIARFSFNYGPGCEGCVLVDDVLFSLLNYLPLMNTGWAARFFSASSSLTSGIVVSDFWGRSAQK